MKELRPYQKECVETVNNLPDGSRSIVCLATGLGKTFVASRFETKGKVLWLSHRDELVRQPAKYFTDPEYADHVRTFGIEKAGERGNGEDVISASTFTLSQDKRLETYAPDYFDLIVCDEAHHAAAKTYRKVLDYFKPRKLIGLTATPKRGDGVRLTDVFDSICYQKDLRWGIENGYLSRIRCIRVMADMDLRRAKTSYGDLTAASLSDIMMSSDNAVIVARSYMERCLPENKKTIIFCPSVSVCEEIAEKIKGLLPEDKRESIKILTDKVSPSDRSSMLESFKDPAGISCVINCMILTEGTDIEGASVIINDRPTANPSLFAQMVGRGTRLYPGKEYCLVIDVVGKNAGARKICTTPTLLGLDPEELPEKLRKRLESGDLMDEVDKMLGAAEETSVESIVLKQEMVDIFTGQRLFIISNNISRGLAAVADEYQKSIDEKEEGMEVFDGLIVKTQPGDDRHYLIQATYNGRIWISKPNVLGQSVLTVNIPAKESLDGKAIEGHSKPMPIDSAARITRGILKNMISSKYELKWSRASKTSLDRLQATDRQKDRISQLYKGDGNTTGLDELTMMEATNLIELKYEIDGMQKDSARLKDKAEKMQVEGHTVADAVLGKEKEGKEAEEAWTSILERLRLAESGGDDEETSWVPGGMLRVSYNASDSWKRSRRMSEKQENYCRYLISSQKEKGILFDRNIEKLDLLQASYLIAAMKDLGDLSEGKGKETKIRICLGSFLDEIKKAAALGVNAPDVIPLMWQKNNEQK